jgi:hypothetical protein
VRRVAGAAWRFRFRVEREAQARFVRLAGRLERIGAPAALVERARRASADEARHAGLCLALAAALGARVSSRGAPRAREIAPRALTHAQRVLYEVVAACCIAETESVGVLTSLLGAVRGGPMRRDLRGLAADEVAHARLGWAVLAAERARGVDTAFLGPLVPAMLEVTAGPDLFAAAPAELEDETLLEHGVLPRATQRDLFARLLDDVVLPGLAAHGVDPAPARAWLEARSGEVPLPAGRVPGDHAQGPRAPGTGGAVG